MGNATEFLKSIHIRNFRSFVKADIQLSHLNVLVGPIGSGKTNLVHFLEILRSISHGTRFLTDEYGGVYDPQDRSARDQMFNDKVLSSTIHAKICTTQGNGYQFTLEPYITEEEDRFRIVDEQIRSRALDWTFLQPIPSIKGRRAALVETRSDTAKAIVDLLSDCTAYRFDTSQSSFIHRSCSLFDAGRLYPDGSNLASVLYRLKTRDSDRLDRIQHDIRRVMPAFREFDIETTQHQSTLRWKSKSKLFSTRMTSPGSLNLFALVTLLHLPAEMLPRIVILDDPTSQLHLGALESIGDMIIKLASGREVQVIVTTQSAHLGNRLLDGTDKLLQLSCGRNGVTRIFETRDISDSWMEY